MDYSGGARTRGFYTTDLAMVGRTHPSVEKLTFSNAGRTFQAGIHDGTFAAHLQDAKLRSSGVTDSSWPIPAKAYDKDGELIWSGELERSGKR